MSEPKRAQRTVRSLCPLFAPHSVLIYSQKGVCKMTVYEEGLSLLSRLPELYDYLPVHPEKLCMPIMQT